MKFIVMEEELDDLIFDVEVIMVVEVFVVKIKKFKKVVKVDVLVE